MSKSYITPKAKALYAFLFKESEFEGKSTGYKITLLYDEEYPITQDLIKDGKSLGPFQDFLDEIVDKNYEEACKENPKKKLRKWPAYKEEEDGFHVTFKTANKPTVIGPNKNLWSEKDVIGNGSIVRVAFGVKTYQGKGIDKLTGAKLFLNACQVVDWVPYTADFGFDIEISNDEDAVGVEEQEATAGISNGSDF